VGSWNSSFKQKYLHDLIRSELAALDGFRDAVQPLHPDKPPINKRTIRYARSSIIIKNSILKHLRAEEKTVADLIAQLREYAAQQQAAVA
jgi:iron-sulfur cluster repair protein YtfE (RIC family)